MTTTRKHSNSVGSDSAIRTSSFFKSIFKRAKRSDTDTGPLPPSPARPATGQSFLADLWDAEHEAVEALSPSIGSFAAQQDMHTSTPPRPSSANLFDQPDDWAMSIERRCSTSGASILSRRSFLNSSSPCKALSRFGKSLSKQNLRRPSDPVLEVLGNEASATAFDANSRDSAPPLLTASPTPLPFTRSHFPIAPRAQTPLRTPTSSATSPRHSHDKSTAPSLRYSGSWSSMSSHSTSPDLSGRAGAREPLQVSPRLIDDRTWVRLSRDTYQAQQGFRREQSRSAKWE